MIDREFGKICLGEELEMVLQRADEGELVVGLSGSESNSIADNTFFVLYGVFDLLHGIH